MKNETIELMASAGNRTTGGGAIVSFFGWVASSNAIGILGLAVAIIGALVNWYYKRKEREDRLNGNVTGTTK